MKENHSGGTATELERPICEECGQVYGELLDHVYTYVPTVEATCGVEGVLEHYTCSGCDNLFRIIESIYVVVDESDLVIEPLEHNLVYVNDELEGHHQECDRENCNYSTDVVPHEEKGPACGEEVKCVCGYVLHEAGVGEHELTYDYINGLNVCNICDQEVRLENSASWYISGAMNGWDQGYSFYRHPNDNNIRVRAFNLEVGTYPFKVLHKEGDNNLTWYGNAGTMIDGAHGWDFSKDVSADCQITINIPGTYLFELDYNTLKVSVYQIDETTVVGLIGSMNGWTDDYDMSYIGNHVWEVTTSLEANTSYEYKVRYNDGWDLSFGKYFIGTSEDNIVYTPSKTADYKFVFDVNTRSVSVSEVEHQFGELIPQVDPTCLEEGIKAHKMCSHCDGLFVEVENGYIRVTEEDLIIEALDHNLIEKTSQEGHYQECDREGCDYVSEVVEHNYSSVPSFDNVGHWFECSIDNCSYKTEVVPHFGGEATEEERAICEGCSQPYGTLLEHVCSFGEWTTKTPADCENKEVQHRICSNPKCGNEETREVGVALGHDRITKTNEESHWTGCTRCDLEENKEAHEEKEYSCSEDVLCKCGYTLFVSEGHKIEGVEFTPSSKDESKHVQVCSECGEELNAEAHEEKDALCGEVVTCKCGYVLSNLEDKEHVLTYNYVNGEIGCENCVYASKLLESSSWSIAGIKDWENPEKFYTHPNNDAYRVKAYTLEAGTYEFKIINNETWYGNKGTMDGCAQGWVFSSSDDANCKLTIVNPGTYIFELDYKNVKVTVYQIDGTASFGVIGSMNSWVEDVDMTYVGNNVWEAILHLDGATPYEYKVRVNDDWVVSFGKDYLAETNLSYTTTVAGDYLFVFNVNTREITVSLVEHVYGEEIEGTAATCTENGSLAYYTCSHCDAKFIKVENGYQRVTDQELVIEALGHDEKIIFDENYHWVECGRNECDYKSEVEEHKDGEATCTTLAICSVCEQEYGKALGHEMVIAYDKDYHWTKCSRECGEVTEKVKHDGGTATETERAVCTTCSQPYGDLLNHEHNYVKGNVTQPTCEEEGYTTYTCACGESYNDDIVPATGHNYQSVVTQPTCEDKGYTTHTCSACDDTYTDNETNALGHTYVYQGIDTTNKKANYTCSRCSLTDARDKVTVYLVPNTNWKSDNARFAVYYWNSSGNTWVSMVKVNDNLYKADIEVAKCTTGIIFCRMNPNVSSNSWNNKWNQTADLSLTGTSNAYTVKAGTWDSGGGTWSTKND